MVNGIGINQEYKVSNSGLNTANVQETLSKSKQAVTNNLESNSAVKTVAGNTTDASVMRSTLLMLPGLAMVDKFVENKIAGTESSNLLGKIGALGDKISNKLHFDKLISKETSSKISDFISNNRFTKYFTKSYSAIPKSSFAKAPNLTEKYSQELINALKGLTSSESAMTAITDLGSSISSDTIGLLTNLAKDGANPSNIPVDKLLNAADDLVANGVNAVQEGGLIPKNINILGISNKLKAANMQMGKTGIGKLLSKGFLKSKDTITFSGGLMGLAFMANAIIQAVKATKEAPKGEKKATFMHVLSENYVGLLLFQPCINLLYKIGGNKYRGMSIEGRNALKELVQQANANGALTKEGYKIAKLQQKLLLKGVDKSRVSELAGKSLSEAKTLFNSLKNSGTKLKFWEKPLKAAATLLDTGLDSIKNPSKLGKMGGKLKGFMGGLGRFVLIFMVLQPIVQKPVTKLCHKIFGEPKTYLEKNAAGSAENKTKQDSATKNTSPAPQTTKPSSSETNLLKIFSNKPQAADNETSPSVNPQNTNTLPQVSPQQQNSEIPALNIFDKNKDKKEDDAPGYIPSIVVDNSYMSKQESELQKKVDAFIAQKDKELKQASSKR